MANIEISSREKRKYINAFSNVSQEKAELVLGFEFDEFYKSQISIEEFITRTAPELLKKKICERLSDCIESEGFPEASISPMNQAVVADNVRLILQALVSHCRRTMNRDDLILSGQKQMMSKGRQFGIIQMNDVDAIRYVLVVETIGDSLGNGLTQLLLTLKSMWDVNNDQKMVYGLLTTAINWQLVTYDGQTWKLSEPSTLLLANIEEKEERWLKNNTQILDVMYSILSSI